MARLLALVIRVLMQRESQHTNKNCSGSEVVRWVTEAENLQI